MAASTSGRTPRTWSRELIDSCGKRGDIASFHEQAAHPIRGGNPVSEARNVIPGRKPGSSGYRTPRT